MIVNAPEIVELPACLEEKPSRFYTFTKLKIAIGFSGVTITWEKGEDLTNEPKDEDLSESQELQPL